MQKALNKPALTEHNPPADLIQVGRVVGAFGIRGWIKIDAFGQHDSVLPDAIQVWVDKGRDPRPQAPALHQHQIDQIRVHGDVLVAKLDGIDDRDAAAAMKASRIWVSRAAFPETDDDEYYWVDLVGCDVVGVGGESLGQIKAIQDHGADPVMQIEQREAGDQPGGKVIARRLIPFVDAYVTAVDMTARIVTVAWEADWDED